MSENVCFDPGEEANELLNGIAAVLNKSFKFSIFFKRSNMNKKEYHELRISLNKDGIPADAPVFPTAEEQVALLEQGLLGAPVTQTAQNTQQKQGENSLLEDEELSSAEKGPYSNSDAFAGFDTYTGYDRGTKEDINADAVTLGETILKEHYTAECHSPEQLPYGIHEAKTDVETLEAGAVGRITSQYLSMSEMAYFILYNPADEPAAFEDCIIIGIENENADRITFSNGVEIYTMEYPLKTDPSEKISEILGDPYEKESSENETSYYWRDEEGDHILNCLYGIKTIFIK